MHAVIKEVAIVGAMAGFLSQEGSEYHCNLSYSWGACWRVDAHHVEIEV
jgi:hypothetical protein